MSEKKFVIMNDEREPVFWSNENGWGTLSGATRFTESEMHETPDLVALGGEWFDVTSLSFDLAPVDCLGCGAQGTTELGPFQNDGEETWALCTCVVCGYAWYEVYKFSHVEAKGER